jgi:hypothetical protein
MMGPLAVKTIRVEPDGMGRRGSEPPGWSRMVAMKHPARAVWSPSGWNRMVGDDHPAGTGWFMVRQVANHPVRTGEPSGWSRTYTPKEILLGWSMSLLLESYLNVGSPLNAATCATFLWRPLRFPQPPTLEQGATAKGLPRVSLRRRWWPTQAASEAGAVGVRAFEANAIGIRSRRVPLRVSRARNLIGAGKSALGRNRWVIGVESGGRPPRSAAKWARRIAARWTT